MTIDDIYNRIYSTSRQVFLERIEKTLNLHLKDKVASISRVGKELLLEVDASSVPPLLEELRNNKELEVRSLGYLNDFTFKKKTHMILNFFSTGKNLSIIIKVKLPPGDLKNNYSRVVEQTEKFFKTASFYKEKDKKYLETLDVKIFGSGPEGLDSYDLYLNIDKNKDMIVKTLASLDISKVIDDGFFRGFQVNNLIAYISRFDWKAGIFPELCLCMAFEEALQLKIPGRAKYIRMLLSELYRLSNHIYYISNICSVLGCDTAADLSLLERERILSLIEAITNSRMIPNFVRVGGVIKDIGGDVLQLIRNDVPIFFRAVHKIENMVLNDFTVMERLKGTGMLDKNTAEEFGVSGPNLRASGIRFDLRKDEDFIDYKNLSFTIPLGNSGDCLDRVFVRFGEIYQSTGLVDQILGKLTAGTVIKKVDLSNLDPGCQAASSAVECPHGVFKIYVEIEEGNIGLLAVMGPSLNSIASSEEILTGCRLEDVELVLTSLDISAGEIIGH